jgi:rubrerythrin
MISPQKEANHRTGGETGMNTFKCGNCGYEKEGKCKPQKCPTCGGKKTFEKKEE